MIHIKYLNIIFQEIKKFFINFIGGSLTCINIVSFLVGGDLDSDFKNKSYSKLALD